MQKPIDIFWTGGWDSTYRVVELVLQNQDVFPIYVIDRNRKSWQKEIETLEKLRKMINKTLIGGTVLDINYIELDNIKDNNSITCAYQVIRKAIPIGTQYDWLARLAVEHPGIELGIEKPSGEYSGCVDAIERFGGLKQQADSWVVAPECSTSELNLLFGNFSFPLIQFTELDMVANIKKWHCESIMKQIWFCHSPIDGKPCGRCRPCHQKMECGMKFLLPLEAQRRYRIDKLISPFTTLLKRLMSLVRFFF